MNEEILTWSHQNRVAWRKAGSIQGWEAFKWEAVDIFNPESKDVMITGGIPRIITRGKNKGRKSWSDKSSHRRVVITQNDINEEINRYVHETGNCHKCLGTGQVWIGWNHITGNEFKTCPLKCKHVTEDEL